MSAQSDKLINAYFDIGSFQNTEGFSSLKSILLKFLAQEKGIVYPVKEARIISFHPLRITDDDGATYVEMSLLEEEIIQQFQQQQIEYEEGSFKVVFVDWNFILCKVPNSFDHYFDIQANRYRIEELDEEEDTSIYEDGQCITDEAEVSIAMRERQRQLLNQHFKDTRKILGFETATPTQDKSRTHFTTLNKVLPTINSSASSDSDIVDLRYFGLEGEDPYTVERESEMGYLNILTADQLLDPKNRPKDVLGEVDRNLPQSPSLWNPDSCQESAKKNGRIRQQYFSSAKNRGFGFNNLNLIGKRQESEPSCNPVDIQDIGYAIMEGKLKWSDINFDTCHFEKLNSVSEKQLKTQTFREPGKIIKLLRH